MAILDLAKGARELAGYIDEGIGITRMSLSTDTDKSEYRAIQWAVQYYSKLAPRELVARFQPTSGVYQYAISDFITGFNPRQYRITSIVWPGDSTDIIYDIGVFKQNQYDKNDWSVARNPSDNDWYLRFLNGTEPVPSNSYYVWVYYTAPHTVDSSTDTITSDAPDDVYALHYLIAARLLNIAAATFAQQSDPTMSISAIDNENKSTAYNRRAQDCMSSFNHYMKVSGNTLQTAFVDWDSSDILGGDMFWNEYWGT